MYLYRVCFPENVNPVWEDSPLPGGQNTLTGFWSPYLEAVISIYNARVDYAAFEYGGGTYSRIYRIKKDRVVTEKIDPERKSGHKDSFDKDEIFVSALLECPEEITETLELKQ